MTENSHERAQKLLIEARIEGVSDADRQWLESHLAGCAQCSRESSRLAVAIHSLHASGMGPSPEVVRRTSFAVRRRAAQLRERRENALPLWIGAAASCLWAIVTAPLIWSGFAWAGRLLHVSGPVLQLAFVTWWFMPGAVLSALAAWRHGVVRDDSSNWSTQPSGRSL